MRPYTRICRCGWLRQGLRMLGLSDGHTERCDTLHGLGFRAYVAEQRATWQQQHSVVRERLEAALVDPYDLQRRRN